MLSKYEFKKQNITNSFQDRESDGFFYFPINDSVDFPKFIREKAEELINELIETYEKENGKIFDSSKFYLDARIEVYFNQDRIPIENICIFIDNIEGDLGFEKNMQITPENTLYYALFKSYFVAQLEKVLFVQWYSQWNNYFSPVHRAGAKVI